MRRGNRAQLGLCLPVLALLGLVGCEDPYRGDGRYGGYHNRAYAYPYGGYDDGAYAYPYGRYDRGWRVRDRDDRNRYARDKWKEQWGRNRDDRDRYAGDDWKERRYERRKNNGRPGDAERFNNRLCHNGIRGDAPADCRD